MPERNRTAALACVFAANGFALTGVFMFGPLLVFRLNGLGASPATIGLFSTAVWVGVLVTTPFASQWVRRIGHRGALALSGAIPLAAIVGVATTESVPFWALCHFVSGGASALRWIVSEAAVAEFASDARRGRVVGLYQTMMGGCIVGGPALLAMLGPSSMHAIWASGALITIGLLAGLPMPNPQPMTAESAPAGSRSLLANMRRAPAVMIAGILGGFFEMGITSLLPVAGLQLGFSAAAAALLVSASGAGSALMMLPIGELADRWTRRTVLLGCASAVLVACLALPWAAHAGFPLAVAAFVWGGAGGALYTLAMIEIGHRHRGPDLIEATSVLVLAYTLGGLFGPAVAGAAIGVSPRFALPAVLAVIAALGLLALTRLLPRAPSRH